MSGLLLLRRHVCSACRPHQLHQIRCHATSLLRRHDISYSPSTLPTHPARTRFAPSPTGYLHLGSLRTALFNYLLAKATGGQFLIRLEDTDQTRFVEDAESRLYEDLKWAGLSWDEAPDIGGPYGPYKQSERLHLYRQHAEVLLENGNAFRCFCSKETLEFHQQTAGSTGATTHYPGTCLEIPRSESDRRAMSGEPHTIRFKTSETPVVAPDLVYGAYKKAEREDNFIIMKTDGYPTYHFANVVDDHFMEITHVIRGAEWLISTPKHVELYNAFGWQPPKFAHVGLLVDAKRQKLSKRDILNIGISSYREKGILPPAVMNFGVLLGWNPNLKENPQLNKKGLLTLDEMEKSFSLKFTRGDIVVDMTKLKYFQGKYTESLVREAPTDSPVLVENIIAPIEHAYHQMNEELMAYSNTGDPVSPFKADEFLESLDKREYPFPPKMHEHIHQVLKIWKGPVEKPDVFIRDNRYLFWSTPKKVLTKGFDELKSHIHLINLQRSDSRLEDTGLAPVMVWLANQFAEVKEADWNVEILDPLVKTLVNEHIQYTDKESGQVMSNGAGWKFIRWALLGGMPGTQIVPLMVLLGQEETIYRLRLARRVASTIEDKEEVTQDRVRPQTEDAAAGVFKKVETFVDPRTGLRADPRIDSTPSGLFAADTRSNGKPASTPPFGSGSGKFPRPMPTLKPNVDGSFAADQTGGFDQERLLNDMAKESGLPDTKFQEHRRIAGETAMSDARFRTYWKIEDLEKEIRLELSRASALRGEFSEAKSSVLESPPIERQYMARRVHMIRDETRREDTAETMSNRVPQGKAPFLKPIHSEPRGRGNFFAGEPVVQPRDYIDRLVAKRRVSRLGPRNKSQPSKEPTSVLGKIVQGSLPVNKKW